LNAEERLATLFVALRDLGLDCLVMGGHAVRFYGVDRNTLDYDLHVALAPTDWAQLDRLLATSPLFRTSPPREGPSWRPEDFRRFVIGTLSDGREERLEFWRQNHLLAPFAELQARRTDGMYGGKTISFLGIEDLIHSKETEREDDWRDVALLEEIADERLAHAGQDDEAIVRRLASLRSRRGLERALAERLQARAGRLLDAAAARLRNPVSAAFLAPFRPNRDTSYPGASGPIAQLLGSALRTVEPGTARHLALTEAVRRLYRQAAIAADRADKERAQRTAR
jgi:hypothetical protein